MKIYNSSTNQLVPIEKKEISIYNCGPTVYNYVHIGNVRPLIVFDVLYRYLSYLNISVKYIHNLTDIDDKIIKAASEQNITEVQLTQKYIDAYLDLFGLLNIKQMHMPKVSDHINDIIKYIEKLVSIGAAYLSNGDVYFDLKKAKNYGCVSHKKIDELLDGVRKENNENKHFPLDFVLWKQTTDGINWNSPWGKGRPGWHTECTVLINKYIGNQVDIHGGGVDLKFPHHENENAQNYAFCEKDIANIWMHVGHVNINNQKMAKSANNFILVKDIINQNNSNGLRWLFYQTKYENPINFSNDILLAATNDINKVLNNINATKTNLIINDIKFSNHNDIDENFSKWLQEDLNLPNSVSVIYQQVKQMNQFLKQKEWSNLSILVRTIENELKILGITLHDSFDKLTIDQIKKWNSYIKAKDFTKADSMRKILSEKGLI